MNNQRNLSSVPKQEEPQSKQIAADGRRLDFFVDMDKDENAHKIHSFALGLCMEEDWIRDAILMICETFKSIAHAKDPDRDVASRVEDFGNKLQTAIFSPSWEADIALSAHVEYLKKGEHDYAADRSLEMRENYFATVAAYQAETLQMHKEIAKKYKEKFPDREKEAA